MSTHISTASRTALPAQSELRKYNDALDIACLCDGNVFLAAYAKYRSQELSEETLTLYGEQYILDQHIKHGVRAEELIRIYFCCDDKSPKNRFYARTSGYCKKEYIITIKTSVVSCHLLSSDGSYFIMSSTLQLSILHRSSIS